MKIYTNVLYSHTDNWIIIIFNVIL